MAKTKKEKVSAIYKIFFSNKPNIFYIGSALDFNDRKIRHTYHLHKGIHKNTRLLRMYRKYGVANLCFEVIEIVKNPTELLKREQHYIDLLTPELNILQVAGSALGYKHSDITKKHLSSINKGRKMTSEQNIKNSIAQKGNTNALGSTRSKEFKEKLSALKKKPVINKNTGEIYSSLTDAARHTSINYNTLAAKLLNRITNNTNLSYL